MLSTRHKTIWRARSVAAAVAVTLGVTLGACGDAPELPPADSMELPTFFEGTNNGLTLSSEQTTHIALAKFAVGAITLAVNVVLLGPRLIFAGTLGATPKRESGQWVWRKTFPVLGYETALHGSLDDALELEMRVTGTRDNTSRLQDFVWFDGTHQRTEGVWRMYDPAVETYGESLLRIDWERQSATDKRLVFTNVTTDRDGSGDALTYRLDGTAASMTILDAKNKDGVPADFSAEWSTEDGSGRMTANGETYCWDTVANGQVNVDCP